jgi:hypothetical protein
VWGTRGCLVVITSCRRSERYSAETLGVSGAGTWRLPSSSEVSCQGLEDLRMVPLRDLSLGRGARL